jgi:DNA-binding SARP family transcriptional activator
VLCRVSVVSEFTGEIAATLSADPEAPALLAALHRRQLFISRRAGSPAAYRFHDLFREFLSLELSRRWPAAECARLRSQAAAVLATQERQDEAVDLALAAADWELAQRLLLALAPVVIKEGRRARFTNWCQQLPADVSGANGWLCHWLGVANMSNDMAAEQYFEQAYELLNASHDDRGAYLTAVNAVLSKTDSWRTHTGLSRWTRRVLSCLDHEPQDLSEAERALGWSGTLRAIEFADDYRVDRPTVERLLARTSAWLEQNAVSQDVNLRVAVSQSLIEYAGTDGKRELFDRAVDSVSGDLRHRELAPWVLGLWLVAFGSMSGRYFPFSRRGFPYPDAQAALRAAADIGVREQLRGVEFGALYHLQLLAKLRGSFEEFGMLVDRLAGIADSRYTTQVAIVADCQAARWTIEGSASRARPFCEQFMLAIEKADEPPIERWPHYITQFQVELRAGDYDAARNQLTAVLPQFDGEVRRRTAACVAIAEALRVRDEPDATYPALLRRAMDALAASNYFSVLLNLPDVLASLCDDALGIGAQDEYCKQLIAQRKLAPPTRSAHWPWTLCIHVLGDFRLMLHGCELDVGPKAPRKSLDLLKLLASARDQRLALDAAHEAIWPDADGAQAKAACDQALHRLRKWLGGDDLVVQREGHLKLDSTRVWVDLQFWQQTLAAAQAADAAARAGRMDRALEDFAGPLLDDDVVRLGLVRQTARIESDYLDATDQVFRQLTGQGGLAPVGQRVYARALRHFPTSERALEGLLRARILAGEHAAAVAEFRRFEKTVAATRGGTPSARLRHLIAPLLA